ncbi:MAG: cytochrome C [Sulfurovum sp.]|nr:cytochrome C [Sulfurovum sp.]MCB4760497.1 cytochrome C [Sulfurovum sp.]
MKLSLLLTVVSIFVLLSRSAMASGYTQADRIVDMQKMAQAMQDIQSGLLYNNIDIIKAGTRVLKDTIVKIHATDEEINSKDIYEKWLNNNLKMTSKIQKKIVKKAEILEERFETGDAVQALQQHSKIIGQCMKCHVRLRKW